MNTFYFKEDAGWIAVMLRAEEPVNAWEGKVIFGKDALLAISSNGITDIWQKTPALEGDGIVFAGGKIGGFSGEGEIFRFALRQTEDVAFSSGTRIYLHDGKGTEGELRLISMARAPVGAIVEDKRPPEPFSVTIFQDQNIFNGQPVAIFQAEDSGTGIARYEVREHLNGSAGSWHEAESPYLLHEDVVRLEVRAIDNAGNSRVEGLSLGRTTPLWAWLCIAVLLAGAFYVMAVRYTRSKP